jgi:hypothetical protein
MATLVWVFLRIPQLSQIHKDKRSTHLVRKETPFEEISGSAEFENAAVFAELR